MRPIIKLNVRDICRCGCSMKLKRILKFIVSVSIIFLLVYWIGHTIKENKQKIITVTLEKEPDFISTSNGGKLLTVVNGEIIAYDATGNSEIIRLNMNIAKVYACDEMLWVIDDKANLYTLYDDGNNTYEISDVLLENVACVDGDSERAIAITINGEVYVWGKDEEYYTLGLGDVVEAKLPTKIEGIENAKEVQFFGVNTAILTENGELYVAGSIISSEWSEEKQGYDVKTEYVKEFVKIDNHNYVTSIGEYEGLYTVDEDGIISRWSGIKANENGEIELESLYEYWGRDLRFVQLSYGSSFSIGIDEDGYVYYWGFDFTRKIRNKSDYTVHTNPQLLQFHKNVESVYAVGDVAFLKNGLELYIVSNE